MAASTEVHTLARLQPRPVARPSPAFPIETLGAALGELSGEIDEISLGPPRAPPPRAPCRGAPRTSRGSSLVNRLCSLSPQMCARASGSDRCCRTRRRGSLSSRHFDELDIHRPTGATTRADGTISETMRLENCTADDNRREMCSALIRTMTTRLTSYGAPIDLEILRLAVVRIVSRFDDLAKLRRSYCQHTAIISNGSFSRVW